MFVRLFYLSLLMTCLCCTSAQAQGRKAPPGMFKDLDGEIVDQALLIHGKQLFLDDYVIDELRDAWKVLNQPVKHPRNPLMVRDRPSDGFQVDYGTILYDKTEGLFKLWYQIIHTEGETKDSKLHEYLVGYATSRDGIKWDKPITDKQAGNNHVVINPPEPFFGGPGVILDPIDTDPKRRYKMLYLGKPTGKSSSLSTRVAHSPDGIHWTQESQNLLIPYSDTQVSPYWDARKGSPGATAHQSKPTAFATSSPGMAIRIVICCRHVRSSSGFI